MQKITWLAFGLCLLCLNINAQENHNNTTANSHAPINVMRDHSHEKGEIMLSYRYMPMWMDGNRSGTREISNAEVFSDFMVSPQTMQMHMHMVGIMYAPINNLTLMLMGNYISNEMNLVTRMGEEFTTKSEGVGDVSISSIVSIAKKNNHTFLANLGVSIPVGDIDQKDENPMGVSIQLAYPMQIGSGTLDPFLGITYTGKWENYSWGGQASYKARFGKNSNDYRLGNQLKIKTWAAYGLCKTLSVSTGLNFRDIEKISGSDPKMNPNIMPLFNTRNSGQKQLESTFGINFLIWNGTLKDLRLAVEGTLPIVQDVSGIQMSRTASGTIGLQYTIK